jgi:hypothetical protein
VDAETLNAALVKLVGSSVHSTTTLLKRVATELPRGGGDGVEFKCPSSTTAANELVLGLQLHLMSVWTAVLGKGALAVGVADNAVHRDDSALFGRTAAGGSGGGGSAQTTPTARALAGASGDSPGPGSAFAAAATSGPAAVVDAADTLLFDVAMQHLLTVIAAAEMLFATAIEALASACGIGDAGAASRVPVLRSRASCRALTR